MKIWRGDTVKIGTTLFALGALTLIFFFQNQLVRRPKVYTWVRRGYLLFILVWLGWYANAQLSVVNVLTFANSLLTGFSWEYFLSAPLIFLLWCSIAAGLLFWGRGPFCGWLCPFGALQELLNNIAQAVKIPQYRLPWGLHERLWPLKYIVFLGCSECRARLLSRSNRRSRAVQDAVVLKFAREWPYVIALACCRPGFSSSASSAAMCPLGAARHTGRVRMRIAAPLAECGSLANAAPRMSGAGDSSRRTHNVNECIYCMHCQELISTTTAART
jgi:NosR/NirI family nitrous oxide reductase transcriptional regulator